MNEASNAAPFVTALLTCLSVSEDEAFRRKISVVKGCLNLPGVETGVGISFGFDVVKLNTWEVADVTACDACATVFWVVWRAVL